ncbi:MAG: hypothetical protein ACI4ON_03400 [Clostridia bacterium]
MFLFKKKIKKNALNDTLRNFLSYMLYNRDEYVKELSQEYSEKERYEFIYNCVLNTIDEYIHTHKSYNSLFVSSGKIIRLFKENFMLRQFERNSLSVDIPDSTKEIIKEFSYLKETLNNIDKNYIIANVNEIIASTI